MSTQNATKINQLLQRLPSGVVVQAMWLTDEGYSSELQKRYRKSNWFESIGVGAMIRTGDNVSLEGGIYALQNQSGSFIHPGGKTALSYLGKAQYLELATKTVTVFGERGKNMPGWFIKHSWGVKIDYFATSFLPAEIGLTEYKVKNFSIKISGFVRAMMECLYLADTKEDLTECFELMEGLNSLRPDQVQEMLELCGSIKVKRLFLYMAEKAGHSWFVYLKPDKIFLGSGKRSFTTNGVYVPKYQITVPKELEQYD